MSLRDRAVGRPQEAAPVSKRIGRWGVGPLFTAVSLGYSAAALCVTAPHRAFFWMKWLPEHVRWTLASLLALVGVAFFLLALRDFGRAYASDELVTTGTYSWCRHPIYASRIVFPVPALVLFADSWLGLTVPLFMYAVARVLVRREEKELVRDFGRPYTEYRQQTPCILPFGRCLLKQRRK